jgi:hypothetical protein
MKETNSGGHPKLCFLKQMKKEGLYYATSVAKSKKHNLSGC